MDLNADLGESWYKNQVGNDEELMPLLDSCNVACGFHGGDALTMQETIKLAFEHNVAIGAHPSFPDRKNFGRKRMELPLEELEAMLLYQIGALQSMVRAQGGTLHHVKPHGALYHFLNEDRAAAETFVHAVKQLGVGLIYGPPEGALASAARFLGVYADRSGGPGGPRSSSKGAKIGYWNEGFADRRYEVWRMDLSSPFPASQSPTLHLRSRQFEDATIDSPVDAANQVRKMVAEGKVTATDGLDYALKVSTICIHGDHPGAIERGRAIRAVLDELAAK